MKRVLLVGGVIIIFFLTLALTLPEIGSDTKTPLSATLAEASLQGTLTTPATEPALTPTETPGVDLSETPALSPLATPLPNITATPIVIMRPKTEITAEVTLRELGITQFAIKGLLNTGYLWMPLPSNWDVQYLQFDLRYVASPLLHPERANMTILANDQLVTSFRLNAGENIFSFEIPINYVDPGNGFSLSFEGYLRITDLVCEETDNPGQWVNILDSSLLTIGANPGSTPLDLKNMGRLLMPQNVIGAVAPVVFVLPDDPDPVVLSTAIKVATRLSMESGFEPVRVSTVSSLTETDRINSNLIVLGVPEDQPLIEELVEVLPARFEDNRFFTVDGFPVPPEHGVTQIMRSPWNSQRTILLISAGNTEGLEQAGRAFADRSTFEALEGLFQFISTQEPQTLTDVRHPWQNTHVMFTSLGYGDRTMGGGGLSGVSYFLRWPPGWMVAEGSQVTLNLAISPAIKPDSHIRVLVNDVFVGTALIEPGITSQTFTFQLPPDIINATLRSDRIRTMKFQVQTVNILATDECMLADTEIVWARIRSDSFFTMQHDYMPLPELHIFPYPFVADTNGPPVRLVLPDTPTEFDLEMGLSIAAKMGSYALGDLDIDFLTASQLSEGDHGDAHLIILGVRARQPWIYHFLTALPPLPKDSVYQAENAQDVGLLLEAQSPWNDERTLLLVFGESANGFRRAAAALFDSPPISDFGSITIFDGQPSEAQPPNGFPYTIAYTLEQGESISQLARRFNSAIDAILVLNDLTATEPIYIGQTLLIPVHEAPQE